MAETRNAFSSAVARLPAESVKNGTEHVRASAPAGGEPPRSCPEARLQRPVVSGRDLAIQWKAGAHFRLGASSFNPCAGRGGTRPLKTWSLHDLRRSARSAWPTLGVDERVCEALLNHTPADALLVAYDRRDFLAEKTQALEKWATAIENAIADPGEGAAVVRLAKKA